MSSATDSKKQQNIIIELIEKEIIDNENILNSAIPDETSLHYYNGIIKGLKRAIELIKKGV